jgi:hypothetical protein
LASLGAGGLMRNLAEVAATGDRAAILLALRNRLAAEIDAVTEPRDLPPLALRLQSVLNELAELTTEGDSRVDDLRKRREARRANATNV